eukprot:1551822-Pyramimonas_sp.AAC.1
MACPLNISCDRQGKYTICTSSVRDSPLNQYKKSFITVAPTTQEKTLGVTDCSSRMLNPIRLAHQGTPTSNPPNVAPHTLAAVNR